MLMSEKKRVIEIDFDGALHLGPEEKRDPAGIGGFPATGAFQALHAYTAEFEVVITSWRFASQEAIQAAKQWLNDWEVGWRKARVADRKKVPETLITAQVCFAVPPKEADLTAVKIGARNVTFAGTWPTVKDIRTFQPAQPEA